MKIVSISEAREHGLTRYFTGEPCVNGHIEERQVSNRGCIGCLNQRTAKYKAQNKDKVAELWKRWISKNKDSVSAKRKDRYQVLRAERIGAMKAWRDENREKVVAYRKQYRLDNIDKVNEIYQAWSRANRHITNANFLKRRAQKISATVRWDEEFTHFVSRQATMLAGLREKATGIKWHVDHLIPLRSKVACGFHTWANLQVIPSALNLWKANKMVLTERDEWIRCL